MLPRFCIDIVDMICFLPNHISMMLDKQRVIKEFSTNVFLLLYLYTSIFDCYLKVSFINILYIIKHFFKQRCVSKHLRFSIYVSPDLEFFLILTHTSSKQSRKAVFLFAICFKNIFL